MNICGKKMAKVFCLFLCLLSFSFVDCQFGLLTDSISNVLRSKRYVDDKVPSCPDVNNMPARCVDLENQCPRLYKVVNANKNNPKFAKTLMQLQCGSNDAKNPLVCCPVEWIPKTLSSRTEPSTRSQTPAVTKPSETQPPLPEESCKSLNAGHLPGRCVSLLECPALYRKAIERSQDPAVLKEMFQIHCGWVDNDPKRPQVCCPIENIATPAPTQPSDQFPKFGDAPSQDSEDLVDTLPSPRDCGPFNLLVPKVIGGRPAKLNMFPWMAILGYHRPSRFEWWCGGSLISTRHVLTAAHCIHGNEESLSLVRLGELDLARDDDGATPIDIHIKKKVIHEEFVPKTKENDIGILTLATEVEYSDLIKPICLPMRPDLRSNNFVKTRPYPFLAGWGQIKYAGKTSTSLQFTQVPITSTAECSEIYKKDDENFKSLDNRSLCAGFKEGKRDACPGDSGGPLMMRDTTPEPNSTRFYQIGIISHGKSCGAPGYPGIYVRVTEYIPWIVKQTTGKIVS